MMRAMKMFIRFAVVVTAVLAMTISSAHAAKKFVTIAGGASGGTYIVVATGMAKILSKYIPGMRANAEVTGGGFGNTRLIGTKRADFGLTTPDAAYFAVKGGGRFKPGEKYKLRALMSGHASIEHFVTLRKSGIKSVYDYKGKRISIGQPGSSTAVMGVAMLEVLGISTKQFARTDHLTQTEAVAALKDGTIDATIQLAGIPGGAVKDITSTHDVRLVPVSMEDMKKINKVHPYWTPSSIPKGTYNGMKGDVGAMASATIVITHVDMDNATVYAVTKTILDHTDELAAIHRAGSKYKLPGSAGKIPIPIHPGAARYFKEKGIK